MTDENRPIEEVLAELGALSEELGVSGANEPRGDVIVQDSEEDVHALTPAEGFGSEIANAGMTAESGAHGAMDDSTQISDGREGVPGSANEDRVSFDELDAHLDESGIVPLPGPIAGEAHGIPARAGLETIVVPPPSADEDKSSPESTRAERWGDAVRVSGTQNTRRHESRASSRGSGTDGQRSVENVLFEVGHVIDERYRILPPFDGAERSYVSSGAMGVVYKTERSTVPGKERALKVMMGVTEESQKELLEEAEHLGQMNHPNVCDVYDAGLLKGKDGRDYVYMVIELLTGGTLSKKLKAERAPSSKKDLRGRISGLFSTGRVSQSEVHASVERDFGLSLIEQLAAGLSAAHAKGILHLDLKPDNVLYDENGVPKLIDFGLAGVSNRMRESGEQKFVGTPAYASPEQALFVPELDVRTDVYGLGAVWYHVLAGNYPFAHLGKPGNYVELLEWIVHRNLPSPRQLNRKVPKDVDAVVMKMMARHPDERYQSMDELLSDIKRIKQGRVPRARKAPVLRVFKEGVYFAGSHKKKVGAALLAASLLTANEVQKYQYAGSARKSIAEAQVRFNSVQDAKVWESGIAPVHTDIVAALSIVQDRQRVADAWVSEQGTPEAIRAQSELQRQKVQLETWQREGYSAFVRAQMRGVLAEVAGLRVSPEGFVPGETVLAPVISMAGAARDLAAQWVSEQGSAEAIEARQSLERELARLQGWVDADRKRREAEARIPEYERAMSEFRYVEAYNILSDARRLSVPVVARLNGALEGSLEERAEGKLREVQSLRDRAASERGEYAAQVVREYGERLRALEEQRVRRQVSAARFDEERQAAYRSLTARLDAPNDSARPYLNRVPVADETRARWLLDAMREASDAEAFGNALRSVPGLENQAEIAARYSRHGSFVERLNEVYRREGSTISDEEYGRRREALRNLLQDTRLSDEEYEQRCEQVIRTRRTRKIG